jgi:hypothetical protein
MINHKLEAKFKVRLAAIALCQSVAEHLRNRSRYENGGSQVLTHRKTWNDLDTKDVAKHEYKAHGVMLILVAIETTLLQQQCKCIK